MDDAVTAGATMTFGSRAAITKKLMQMPMLQSLFAFPNSWINGCQARRTYLGLTCEAKATYPMSRAFVKEQDGHAVEELPDRPISEHRNDVTREGARHIDADPWSAGYLLRRAADR